jgi:hypothetical protein
MNEQESKNIIIYVVYKMYIHNNIDDFRLVIENILGILKIKSDRVKYLIEIYIKSFGNV